MHLESKGQEHVQLVAINYQSVVCVPDRMSLRSLERSEGSKNEVQSPEISRVPENSGN